MSFHFKQFSIIHQSEGLKVNTDGCLLGALANTEKPVKCLDIGTGTGVIALMLAQKYPSARITAVELNETAYKQAGLNIENSKFSDHIQLLHQDILHFETSEKFDLIVCNPPYFKAHLTGPDSNKNMALHDTSLPMDKLVEKITGLISESGIFWVIYPPREMKLLEEQATKNDLHSAFKYNIENKKGKAYRVIGGFKTRPFTSEEETIVLKDASNNRSADFSRIMTDFYL